jgi:hypothetical protein
MRPEPLPSKSRAFIHFNAGLGVQYKPFTFLHASALGALYGPIISHVLLYMVQSTDL